MRGPLSDVAENNSVLDSPSFPLFSIKRSNFRGLLQPAEPRKGRVLGAGAGVETDETRGLDNQGVLDLQVHAMKSACMRQRARLPSASVR